VSVPARVLHPVQHALPRDLLHDLRTPLGHILGYSEMLIEQMQESGREEFLPHLEKIRKAGNDLLDLMNNNLTSAEGG
jgi:signal transduction histidine kinase